MTEIELMKVDILTKELIGYCNNYGIPASYGDKIHLAASIIKAGYRKQEDTVKEFAEKLLDKINNGGWSEDNIYRQGQQAMAGWVTKYIADLAEQFGKEEK